MSDPALPEIHLWRPDAYESMVNSYTLYRGVVLGIAGLLALFLSVLFVVKGTAMFPATAALAWAVFAYISIDFGFWSRVFQSSTATWRRGGPAPRWCSPARSSSSSTPTCICTAGMCATATSRCSGCSASALLAGVIAIDPSVAAGVARLSLGLTAVVGIGIVLWLAIRGFDRAIMLIPTWIILLFWVTAAWLAVTGRIDHSVVQPALAGGLVLVVMLIAFTIMQHAFAGGALAQGLISDSEQKALALVGAGHSIWDWDTARDRIETGREIEHVLGFKRGALDGPARNWLGLIHPSERDLFRAMLDAVVNQRRGRINLDFRMRAEDGHFLWFALRARPIVGSDGEVMRCSGTIADITDQKLAEERLLHDAVHDNLTGLPNRQIFLDRLETALTRSRLERIAAPTVIVFDLDNFKELNSELRPFGRRFGAARAVAAHRAAAAAAGFAGAAARRFLRPSRAVGDRARKRSSSSTRELIRTIKAAISIGDHDVFLTASVGIAPPTNEGTAEEQVRRAEAAVYQAKRYGGDYIQFYEPAFGMRSRRIDIDSELRKALEAGNIDIVYQPVVRLEDNSIAGFEALTRWEHPLHGRIPPSGVHRRGGGKRPHRAARPLCA